MVREMHTLRKLLMLAFAGEQGATLLITSVAEVLARDANACPAAALKIADAQDIPGLHDSQCSTFVLAMVVSGVKSCLS